MKSVEHKVLRYKQEDRMNTTIHNDSTHVSCVALTPPYEVNWIKLMLVLQLAIMTIPPTAVLAKMIHDKVDAAHPVFAVVFQELLVFMMCQMTGLGNLLLSFHIKNDAVVGAYFFGMRLAALFHPSTWLVISYLR